MNIFLFDHLHPHQHRMKDEEDTKFSGAEIFKLKGKERESRMKRRKSEIRKEVSHSRQKVNEQKRCNF